MTLLELIKCLLARGANLRFYFELHAEHGLQSCQIEHMVVANEDFGQLTLSYDLPRLLPLLGVDWDQLCNGATSPLERDQLEPFGLVRLLDWRLSRLMVSLL